jgi:hypothetical protein
VQNGDHCPHRGVRSPQIGRPPRFPSRKPSCSHDGVRLEPARHWAEAESGKGSAWARRSSWVRITKPAASEPPTLRGGSDQCAAVMRSTRLQRPGVVGRPASRAGTFEARRRTSRRGMAARHGCQAGGEHRGEAWRQRPGTTRRAGSGDRRDCSRSGRGPSAEREIPVVPVKATETRGYPATPRLRPLLVLDAVAGATGSGWLSGYRRRLVGAALRSASAWNCSTMEREMRPRVAISRPLRCAQSRIAWFCS